MKKILKIAEWEAISKRYYVSDGGKWWIPARMLGLSLEDFILKLKNEYNASKFAYCLETDCLVFSWDNYEEAHKWVLYINREARKRNFMIDVKE